MDIKKKVKQRSKISPLEREKQWQAEDDARVLKAYAELTKKKSRLEMAKKKLLEEQQEIDKAIKLAK